MKELQSVLDPIMTKVHQAGQQQQAPPGGNPYAGGMPGGPGGMPGSYASGMDGHGSVPEVD